MRWDTRRFSPPSLTAGTLSYDWAAATFVVDGREDAGATRDGGVDTGDGVCSIFAVEGLVDGDGLAGGKEELSVLGW